MDEEITIIDTNTRNEKIKNFFIDNKKILITIFISLILVVFSFYTYQLYKNGHKEGLANKYNRAVIEYENGDKSKIILSMEEIINDRDKSYSPLALFFLIDNKLIENKETTNQLFDVLINKTNLETEIKNLIIYKKALYNSNFSDEIRLLEILNPIINSDSIWKSHSLYLMGEFFYSKNEKNKAKEFFNKILVLPSANSEIKIEAQKRINRDLGE